VVYIGFNPREITSFAGIQNLEDSPFVSIPSDRVGRFLRGEFHSCCGMEHRSMLAVIKHRFGLHIPVPLTSMLYRLKSDDKVIIIVVENIRRIAPEESYTHEELRKARIFFHLHTIP